MFNFGLNIPTTREPSLVIIWTQMSVTNIPVIFSPPLPITQLMHSPIEIYSQNINNITTTLRVIML